MTVTVRADIVDDFTNRKEYIDGKYGEKTRPMRGPYFTSQRINNLSGISALILTDILILGGAFFLAVWVRLHIFPIILPYAPPFDHDLNRYLWIFFIWIFILVYEGAYSRRLTFWDEVKLLWKCTFFATLTVITVLFIAQRGSFFSRSIILTMSLFVLLGFPVIRTRVKRVLYGLGLMRRRILIIGAGDPGRRALRAVSREPDLGYEVAGFIDDGPEVGRSIDQIKVHRGIKRIGRYITVCGIHDVLIAKPDLDKDSVAEIINSIQHRVTNTLFIPDLPAIAVLGTELRHFFQDQTVVIEIKNNLSKPLNYLVKRTLDYSCGLLLLAIFLLPIIIIGILIRLTSPGPAIFTQERIGKHGKPFDCYKFRTMQMNAEEILRDILARDADAKDEWIRHRKLRHDPRVTSIGRFLRATSLDELPQIFNVLRGNMSLVGPRPVIFEEIEAHYANIKQFYYSVPPGITGLWQVSGRSDSTYEERTSLDSWYVRNWNLWLDIVILLKTVNVVISKRGSY